jgi:serine/alanine adding enzyme
MSSRPAATEPTVRIELHDGPPDGWDAWVRSRPESTFCHLSGWHHVFTDGMGHRSLWLVAVDDTGEWTGVLPLVRVRSRLLGDYLLSMPFLNYGGPLGEVGAQRALVERAADEARRLGVDLLELRSRREVDTHALTRSDRKITVILPLPDDPEILWNDGFKSKLRSQIRRPMKEDMEPRHGPDQLEPFYEVFTENMRDLGTPVLPRDFFEAIRDRFADEVRFATVWMGDRPVAGGCGFRHGPEFEITWASSLRAFNRQSPNMLLYWSLMEQQIEEGAEAFNFGRCTPGEGTHRFKSQWGGDDVPLPWMQWSPSGVESTPDPDRPIFRMATDLWSRLPLPVANRLGPFLARRLP